MKLQSIINCSLVAVVLILAYSSRCSAEDEVGDSSAATRRLNFNFSEILTIEKYQKLFNKHYGSALETLARMRLLLARGARVFVSAANYLRGKSRSYKEINHFSDRTKEELAKLSNKRDFSAVHGKTRGKRDAGIASRTRSKTGNQHRLKLDDLYEAADGGEQQSPDVTLEVADSIAASFAGGKTTQELDEGETTVQQVQAADEVFVDHRQCLSAPRDQGYFGACYTFSSIALAEWMYCRDTGEKLLFSEQFILDCGNGYRSLEGGQGGFERDVGAFIDEFGLELLENYPYNEAVNVCPYDRSSEAQKMGYLKVNNYTYREVALGDFESALEETPLVASIDIGEQWYEYGGGVFENPGYDAPDVETHSTLIVGSGRQDGVEYWLVRNSHGSKWGENGYVKLVKSCPCIYLNRGYRSEARFGNDGSSRSDIQPENPHYEQRKAAATKKATAKRKKKRNRF